MKDKDKTKEQLIKELAEMRQQIAKLKDEHKLIERKERNILDNVVMGISMISSKMEIIWLNKTFKNWFPNIDVRKKPLCYQFFYTPPKDKICDYCPTIKAFKTGKVHSSETGICADGKIYNVIATPIRNEKGKIDYVVETVQDITERKKVEEELKENEDRFRRLSDASFEGTAIMEAGNLLEVNKVFAKMFGYKPSEVIGMHVLKLVAPEYHDFVMQKILSGYEKPYEAECVKKDGKRFTVEVCGKTILYKGRKARVTAIRDITERKLAEKALQESEEKYRSLVESTDDSLYLVDKNYRYLFINKKHLSRMGLSKDQYIGKTFSEFHSPEETKKFIEKVDKAFITGKSHQYEYISQRDGRHFFQTFSPVKEPNGRIMALTVISKNVTKLKQMEEELRTLTLTDELTGLYNRRGFFTLVEHVLKVAKRRKKGMFMLYGDIDNLKKINDRFGHKEGDQALIGVANILKKNYREADIVARMSGDEFAVIPAGFAGDAVGMITARLQEKLNIHNVKSSRGYKLSISVGIIYYDPEHPSSINELLVQADKLLYEQKKHKPKS